MSNEKHYPLHPGQTQTLPYYTKVPTEEYEALKREVQQLREITAGNRTTIDDVVEINTLTSEVKALREMNAKAQEEIATLKENQRWRKFPDEKPEEWDTVVVRFSGGFYDLAVYLSNGQGWDIGDGLYHKSQEVSHWMPLPSAPKEEA